MSEKEDKLRFLLSDDPGHEYSDEELDAIEAIDPYMAIRLDRVQFLARKEAEAATQEQDQDANGPISEDVVQEVLGEVRKILSQDGGDIEFVAIEGQQVRVRMKGACVGCPNAVLDLKNVVERLIRSRIPAVKSVINTF